MKPEQLEEVMNWLKVRAEGTENFVLEQTPLFCKELVNWLFWSNLFWGTLSVIFVVATWVIIYKVLKYLESRTDWSPDGRAGTAAFAIIMSAAITGGIGTNALNCFAQSIKAAVAPRVVIVDYLKTELKGEAGKQ